MSEISETNRKAIIQSGKLIAQIHNLYNRGDPKTLQNFSEGFRQPYTNEKVHHPNPLKMSRQAMISGYLQPTPGNESLIRPERGDLFNKAYRNQRLYLIRKRSAEKSQTNGGKRKTRKSSRRTRRRHTRRAF